MDDNGEEQWVLLGAFATMQKATVSFVMSCPSVRSSARMEHLGYHWRNFHEVLYLSDRLCGLVVRVSGYRYRGLGFDSRRYQIF